MAENLAALAGLLGLEQPTGEAPEQESQEQEQAQQGEDLFEESAPESEEDQGEQKQVPLAALKRETGKRKEAEERLSTAIALQKEWEERLEGVRGIYGDKPLSYIRTDFEFMNAVEELSQTDDKVKQLVSIVNEHVAKKGIPTMEKKAEPVADKRLDQVVIRDAQTRAAQMLKDFGVQDKLHNAFLRAVKDGINTADIASDDDLKGVIRDFASEMGWDAAYLRGSPAQKKSAPPTGGRRGAATAEAERAPAKGQAERSAAPKSFEDWASRRRNILSEALKSGQ